MNRIDKKFAELGKAGRKAFIVYIACGDPGMEATEKLVYALEKSGVDIIELGVPFSDPMADGPTIQKASERALKNGVNIPSIINLVKQIRKNTDIPLALMSYYNPIFRYGTEAFVNDTGKAGVDGVIVPDLPPEEAGDLIASSGARNYSCIFLLAPTSTPERIKLASAKSTGFIYYVSLTGVTGARTELPKEVISGVKRVKETARKPVCVGFGVSNEKQVKEIAKVADGVIVGSAVIRIIEKNAGSPELADKVAGFVSKLTKVLR